ncbi:PAS domain S-box protein [Methanobacterium oryzae]|uniref:PAS domain-containing sensor histidine kinase n=1 Tax=Methanobacterium oryzae TaxID=69540 RepID=UPI003D2209CE
MAKSDEWLLKVEKELEKAKENGQISESVTGLVSELRIHQSELEMQNEELRESQEEYEQLYNKYRDLYNDIPVGYFTLDKEGIIRNVNNKGAELLKHDKERIIRRGFSRFIPKSEEWKYYLALGNSIDTGKSQEVELQLKRDKMLFDARMEILPLFNRDSSRYRVIITDITERKKAEDALHESEELYKQFFNNSLLGFASCKILTDNENNPVDFTYLKVNKAFEKFTGLKKEEVLNKKVTEVLPYEEVEEAIQIYGKVALTGESTTFEYSIPSLDKYYEISAFSPRNGYFIAFFTDITERKKAEEELKESEERFRVLADESPVAIAVYRDNRNLYVNPEASSILGYTKDELLKMDYMDFIHPDYGNLIKKMAQARMNGESEHKHYEVKIITKDGQEKWLETSSNLINYKGQPAGIVTSIDITERKKLEAELKEARENLEEQVEERTKELDDAYKSLLKSEGRLKIAMDMAKLAYWEYDVESDTFTFDDRFHTLYGMTDEYEGNPKMSSGEYAQRFLPPEESHWVAEEIDKALKTDNPNFFRQIEHTIIRTDGEKRSIIVRLGVIKNNKGRTIKTYGANQDITELKKTEEKLKETIQELERSNQELQQFAYVSSHDLQEPLRTIASFTQLLERRYKGQLDEDADEFMDFIVEAAIRMKQQIEGLLEYSRVATKGEDFKPVDMNEILNQIIKSLDTSIKESKAKITYDKLPKVMGDEGQLQRVFQNLISNAIKFRKEKEPLRIHISSYMDNDDEYVFSVKDNGIGIEEQYSERIFTIFQRLHTRDVYKGTGIGLSIVKRIIERHGGRIWVESEFGVGSTFYFTIPISHEDI